MNLNQGIHTQVISQVMQLLCLRILETGHDDQNAVYAQGPRLINLIGIEHEVLAQDRQVTGPARHADIGVIALKIGHIG